MKQNITRTAVRIAVCAAIAAALLTGCKNMNGTPSSEAQLLSFAFEKRLNDWLQNDITGVIDEAAKTVTVTVPQADYQHAAGKANRKFKPSFTVSPKARLYKGAKEQMSGITEDLFIKDREYRVVAEDGTKKTYALCIKIAYTKPAAPKELAEEIKQFYGTYRGKLDFDNNHYKTCAVFDEKKAIIYSTPMSSLYVNMEWKKNSELEWVYTTYHKGDFDRKEPKNTATFTVGTDGTVTCNLIVNAMGNAKSDTMKKRADYVFNPDDGEGFKTPVEQ